MNPHESGGESFNSIMDIDSWLSFCHGRSDMDEHLESELMSIIAPPLTQPSSIKQLNFSHHFPSFINSAEATSVTTMALPRGFINTTPPLGNTSTSIMPMPTNTLGVSRPNVQGNGAVKVKKKRVRASRRVPTTVFRTDTSNFKAMVQHFTGIPTESSSSPSSSSCTSTTSTDPTSSEPPFTKPLPHPAVCKMPPSTSNNSSTTTTIAAPTITVSSASATAPVSASVSDHGGHFSFHDVSSPLLMSDMFNTTSSPPSEANDDEGIPEEQITMPAMDAAFFDKLWS